MTTLLFQMITGIRFLQQKGKKAMKKNTLRIVLTALALMAAAAPGALAQGNDKGTSMKAVQRLGRAPVSNEVLRVTLPRPTTHTLSNGLVVLVLEQHRLPTVNFSLWLKPGTLADPKDLPGLATMTAEMLREGTSTRSSAQIAEQVDALGASLDAMAAPPTSFAMITAGGLSDSTEKLLDLMSDVTLHPAFPEDELAKYKEREQADLQEQLSRPSFLARQEFSRVLYGDFPAAVIAPSPEAAQKVTAADLKKFHDAYYVPGNAILGITGDVNTEDAVKLAEKYFGGWHGAANAGPALPPLLPAQPSHVYLVDRPASVQTNIVAGDYAIKRTDPDYFALSVMNQVLGGGPSARLFLNLREEKSYTYGAYSSFYSSTYPGAFRASTEVRNAVTDGSMHELMYEFKRIRDEAVPEQELTESKHAIVAQFALSLESPEQLLNYWLTSQYYGFPADYWEKYPDRVAAVDPPAVQAVAKKYIDLDHLQIIAVGDAKQVKGAMAKYGPLTVTDVNGKPEN
jgi:zinc protease